MNLKGKTINAASFLENYCKKMCVGKCTGVEKGKCKIVQLLNEEDNVPEENSIKIECFCKDCVHWGINLSGETENAKYCEYGGYMVGANGYCVYAERKL